MCVQFHLLPPDAAQSWKHWHGPLKYQKKSCRYLQDDEKKHLERNVNPSKQIKHGCRKSLQHESHLISERRPKAEPIRAELRGNASPSWEDSGAASEKKMNKLKKWICILHVLLFGTWTAEGCDAALPHVSMPPDVFKRAVYLAANVCTGTK